MAKKKHIPVIAEPPTSRSFRFTEKSLCKFWGITIGTLRRWRTTGYGPVYIKVGGRVLYRPEDVKAFEEQTMYLSGGEKIQNIGGGDGTQE